PPSSARHRPVGSMSCSASWLTRVSSSCRPAGSSFQTPFANSLLSLVEFHLHVVSMSRSVLFMGVGDRVASRVYVKRLAVVAWDAISWVLSYFAFVLVRHDLNLSERVWDITSTYLIGAILLQIVGGYYLHL